MLARRLAIRKSNIATNCARALATTMGPPIVGGAQTAAQATQIGAYHAAAAAVDVTQTHVIPAVKRSRAP